MSNTQTSPERDARQEAPAPGEGVTHADMANAIRALSMDAVEKANSGHPGMPMGAADIATVLFTRFMNFDPRNPNWPDRDRFVLSAGHGSMLLYSSLYLLGYEDMTIDELRQFRQIGARTAGHPEFGHASGIETTTGPLGQGIATAVGMALGERLLNARFGDDIVSHYTYVLASDGDLQEGISHEAASLAGHLNLSRLIVLYDDNNISIDGPTELSFTEDVLGRYRAYGWHAERVDGHDPEAIATAIKAARQRNQPSLIACRTTIGYGAPRKQGTAASHGAALGKEEIELTRKALNWTAEPFEVPTQILDSWRIAGLKSAKAHKAWEARLKALSPEERGEFERRIAGRLPEKLSDEIAKFKKQLAQEKPNIASRKASENALNAIAAVMPELVGGSADLTGSNNTKAKSQEPIAPNQFNGSYIHFGVREHAMVAALNGMALHRGLVPYAGTFLVFADYCRPAIRLAALMRQRIVCVMTHDSIGLGEDGPTHQPVEHLASLRAIPNLRVFRPADATETLECWQLALKSAEGPSLLALSRQNLPAVRTRYEEGNLCARGAYELSSASAKAKVTLIATGSEVQIALEAQKILEKEGIPTKVVSMPSMELFEAQSTDYKTELLGASAVRVAIEAGIRFGWDRYVGPEGGFVGMSSFGASAPYQELYRHFAITPEAAVAEAKRCLGKGD